MSQKIKVAQTECPGTDSGFGIFKSNGFLFYQKKIVATNNYLSNARPNGQHICDVIIQESIQGRYPPPLDRQTGVKTLPSSYFSSIFFISPNFY